ncbi:MAG: CRISPR-associated endonuclease Cas2 [Candidatus Weimeria sp.]
MEMENYFFELSESERESKVLVLIIYDIVDNKKRTKFAKLMEGFGIRVQKSAFEAKLTARQYQKLLHSIPPYCSNEDTVRVYKIIGKSQVTTFGIKNYEPEEDDIILI